MLLERTLVTSLRRWQIFKKIWIANECKFRNRLLFKINIASKLQLSGGAGEEGTMTFDTMLDHQGIPLLRMPTQLHSLSANMWASAWLLALALQLQRMPGGLPKHHAMSLVGGTHFRRCINNVLTCERTMLFFFLQKTPKAFKVY